MFGKSLALLAAVAAILVVGPSAASGQENPVLDPESVTPVIPYSVGEQLAARQKDVDDLAQRHPWVPNNAPLPLNVAYVQGSWRNQNGSSTVVVCAIDTAGEHPLWYQENMLRTWAVGGARCNERLSEAAGGGMVGTVRAIGYPSGSQLASASLGTQHEVPSGHGFGWQAYGVASFDRASMSSNQQVKTEVTLTLPAYDGKTNIRWNSRHGCAHPSDRVIECELTSPPFQTIPYPCPGSPIQGAKLGLQPGGCFAQPRACDVLNGRYGIEPNCVTLPPQCPSGHAGVGSTCVPIGPCPAGQVGAGTTCVPISQGSAPKNTALPTITGAPRRGETLVATAGNWAGSDPKSYKYQWQRCNATGASCEDISLAVQQTLQLTAADVRKTVRVAVTAVNAFGTGEPAASAATTIVSGDTRGPTLALTGDLREAEDKWLYDRRHQVVVDARDDSQSGVRRVEFLIDDAIVDFVERPCPLGGCSLEHTFSLDTTSLRYGGHDVAIRAVDEDGNATVESWMVATEPIQTVFELSAPATLLEVETAALLNQADVIDMEHVVPEVGGYVPGDETMEEAFAGYRQFYRDQYGLATDPPVTHVTLGGSVDTLALGPLAAKVAAREEILLPSIVNDELPEEEEPGVLYEDTLFFEDIGMDGEVYDLRDDTDATVSASAKKFSPSYGKMWTYNLPPVDGAAFSHDLRWKQGSLDAFERSGYYDHGYEHDVKLIDRSYSGSRKHPFCKGPSWWAKRGGVEWTTNFPEDSNPYWDENVGDNCKYLDFTVGLEYPREVEERKRYRIYIGAKKGGRGRSPYQLVATKLARNCPGDPRACAVRTPGGDSQLLIGSSKGDAPECRRWRKGRSSRRCP